MIGVEVDRDSLRDLSRALRQEADGKELRKELARGIKAALEPAKDAAKSSIMGMSSGGLGRSPSLRSEIAKKVVTQARLTGRSTGARVRAKTTPRLRDFAHAPRRTSRASGWRHPIFNTDRWVNQTGKIDWFDAEMRRTARPGRAAVKAAMDAMAERIASRT